MIFLSKRTQLEANVMAEQQPVQNERSTEGAERLPEGVAKEIRKLSHDLSNALEIVVQTSYLLGTVELKEPAPELAPHA